MFIIPEIVSAVQLPRGNFGGMSAHMSGLVPLDGGGMIPNPPVKDPGGKISSSVTLALGILKYLVLACILAGGLIGVGGIAIGKFLSHERSARIGVIAILCAFGAAIMFSAIYGLISLFVS